MKFRDEPDFLTQIILIESLELGVKLISISKETKKIKSSIGFPWIKGSIFSDDNNGRWPAAWRIAENSGIYAGCGNSGQAQIRSDELPLPGVWKFVKGEWRKIE